MSVSPLAPDAFPVMPTIEGVKMAVQSVGIKYKDRADLLVAEFVKDTVVAGVFTKSKTASANILWGRKALQCGKARVLIVNSGNSNAFNGRAGEESVNRIVRCAKDLWQCSEDEIYPCATGVIGQPLADEKITSALADIKNNLEDHIFENAAKAICTTDTFSKGATRRATIGGKIVNINGIAKGSGMIAPDMATMLAYIFTDAAIKQEDLQHLLLDGVNKSFNSITVDSDTSTSDTALLFATGKAQNDTSADLSDFAEKLNEVLLELAHFIVKDGEGATKFIEVNVNGAEDDSSAKIIALAIANSPLVKTAIAGEDANWGRIVMAVGKSGQEANRDKMSIAIGGIVIAKEGQLNPDYIESKVTQHMQGKNINISVDVAVADGRSTVWTCDLTHAYITINADYRS
jgi:glutamate N-acetyltransferase/amino-acid N-acetyltransferase